MFAKGSICYALCVDEMQRFILAFYEWTWVANCIVYVLVCRRVVFFYSIFHFYLYRDLISFWCLINTAYIYFLAIEQKYRGFVIQSHWRMWQEPRDRNNIENLIHL